jgi:Uma2 family endonuclease
MVIVEMLSPASRANDQAVKLAEYFRLPSLHHYLIIWPDKPQVAHHRSDAGGQVETQIVTAGRTNFDPPAAVDEIYTGRP